MARCEYEHDAFEDSDVYRGDGSHQCWLEGDHVAAFNVGHRLVKHFCLFHAPQIQTDDDKSWPISERGKAQSELLRELLDEWNKENESNKNKKSFILPGAHCGHIDLSGFVFSHTLNLQDATFTGRAGFSNATFARSAWFASTMFAGEAEFSRATFTGKAMFSSATFARNAEFTDTMFARDAGFHYTTFNGEALFHYSTFSKSTWFSDAKFTGDAMFVNTMFTNVASFDNAIFIGDAWFIGTTFNEILSFIRSEFTLGCNLSELNIPHLNLSRIKISYPFNITKCDIKKLEYSFHIGEKICFNKVKTGLAENAARGTFTFENEAGSPLSFLNMDLSKSYFLGADVSKTRFDSCHWILPEGKEKYQRVAEHDSIIEEFNNVKTGGGKKIDDAVEQLKLLRSLYRQLMKNLEDNREYSTAGDFHYREMQLRQMIAEREGRKAESRILRAYHFFADYGESYKKLGWGIVLSLIATIGLVFSVEAIWNYNRYYFACVVPFVDRLTQITKAVLFGIVPSGLQRAVDTTLVELTFVSQLLIFIETFFVVIVGSLFVMAVNRRFRR
ncbi:MAG: pentapeptide repeat-containing protein [Nitrospinae bacterium]|nr:pentapeptide repeat-containing protein [Nitrospinota bacterium]